ncbi:hypothetical protein QE439_004134 [Pedobacter agri]|nr:hypothetical protein [Pedobacter agri]
MTAHQKNSLKNTKASKTKKKMKIADGKPVNLGIHGRIKDKK